MNIYKLMQIIEKSQLQKEQTPRSSSIETTPEDKSFTFKITKRRSPWSIEVRLFFPIFLYYNIIGR